MKDFCIECNERYTSTLIGDECPICGGELVEFAKLQELKKEEVLDAMTKLYGVA